MAENLWKTIHSAAAGGPDCRLRAHASRSPLRLAVVGAHGADDWLPSPRVGLEVSHVLADPLGIISRRNESHRQLTHSAHIVVFAPHRHRPPSPLAAAEKRAQLEALLIDLTTLPSQPALVAAAAACDADIFMHYGATLIDEPDRAKRRRALELALEGAQARGPCPGPAPAVQLRPAIAGAGVVGAFGDSWVGMGLGELQAAVARVGLLVQPKGITLWGSTACGWAEGKLNRPNAFAPLTGVKYVWLSVGGNDYFKPPDRRQPMPTAAAHDAEVGRCVRQIALAIARSLPGAHVVQFGYDTLCWCENTQGCHAAAATTAAVHDGGCGYRDATCYNARVARVQAMLEASRANASQHPHASAWSVHDIRGTLQREGGVPGAAPGKPNATGWSPNSLYLGHCMHPNPYGFFKLHEELAHRSFRPMQRDDFRRLPAVASTDECPAPAAAAEPSGGRGAAETFEIEGLVPESEWPKTAGWPTGLLVY